MTISNSGPVPNTPGMMDKKGAVYQSMQEKPYSGMGKEMPYSPLNNPMNDKRYSSIEVPVSRGSRGRPNHHDSSNQVQQAYDR